MTWHEVACKALGLHAPSIHALHVESEQERDTVLVIVHVKTESKEGQQLGKELARYRLVE